MATRDDGCSQSPSELQTALLESMDQVAATRATREQLQAVADAAKPRPKANLAAERVEDLYPLSVLVEEETLHSLIVRDWEDAAAHNTPMTVQSRYVGQRAQRIARSGDVTRLKVLRYILLLLTFFRTLKSGGRKVARRLPDRTKLRTALGVPDVIIDRVRKEFCDDS